MDLHRLISGPPPARDLLSRLPSELKQRVLDFVGFEDYFNIRLLSRVCSIAAFERTWNHGLIIRPNKNHVKKLIEVSRRPWLRERIGKIVPSVDDIDHIVVRHWLRSSSSSCYIRYHDYDMAMFNSDFPRILARHSPLLEPEASKIQ
ncbi:hypothetical protein DL98DRAFT_268516 [Cadophora sp. DSE1049]|nr:hypothetical protein DL98DRAFT_268516 [Cadophora sp. DSE1049]